jgi:hypothetical protein
MTQQTFLWIASDEAAYRLLRGEQPGLLVVDRIGKNAAVLKAMYTSGGCSAACRQWSA